MMFAKSDASELNFALSEEISRLITCFLLRIELDEGRWLYTTTSGLQKR
jgi:hypothetical protein